MSTYPNDPLNGFNPSDHGINQEDLEQILANTEFRHQHAEPIVRDLNRHFIDLIGECPNTATGCWFSLNDDNTVKSHIEFVDVLRLSTAFQKIGQRLSLEEIRRSLPSRQSLSKYLHGLVREAAIARKAESVHIGGRRYIGIFRKGK